MNTHRTATTTTTIIGATLAAAALTIGATAPANAAPVSEQQYNRILIGQTKASVRDLLGTPGAVLSRGHNRYGDTLWKVYGDANRAVIVKYLHANTGRAAVVVTKTKCTGTLTDGSLTCAP